MNDQTRQMNPGLLIVLILITSLALRMIGIRFGLPDLYHADEPIVVNHALAFGSGDFNPHFFNIPPLISYLLFFIYGIYYLIGRAFGAFGGTADFLFHFAANPTSFYLIARILFGGLLGTITVCLLYRLAKKYFSAEHAILSAVFLGFNFLHVRDSHYIYADIPLIALLVLSFFPIFKLTEKSNFKTYTLFGVFLGLSVAVKYNGVFILIPFLFVNFFKRPLKLNYLIRTFLISFVMYSILNPYGWLDFKFFLSEFLEQARSESFTGFFHHLSYSLSGAMGWPILIFAFWGICHSLLKKDLKLLAVTIFVLSYYLVLLIKSQSYDRYVLPLIPFLSILAADGLIDFKQHFKLKKTACLLLILLAILPSFSKIFLSDLLFIRKDNRTIAREWFEKSVPDGAKVALDSSFYMPRLKPTLKQLTEKKNDLLLHHAKQGQILRLDALLKQAHEIHQPRYELYFLQNRDTASDFLFSKPAIPYDISAIRNQGIQYIIVGQLNQKSEAFSKILSQNGDLIAKFSPYRNQSIKQSLDVQPLTSGPFLWNDLIQRQRNGQILEIYRLRK